MFVSNGQFYVFVACVAFGGITGVLFTFSKIFKNLAKNNFLKIIFDVIAFLVLSFFYLLFSNKLCLWLQGLFKYLSKWDTGIRIASNQTIQFVLLVTRPFYWISLWFCMSYLEIRNAFLDKKQNFKILLS